MVLACLRATESETGGRFPNGLEVVRGAVWDCIMVLFVVVGEGGEKAVVKSLSLVVGGVEVEVRGRR